LRLVRFRGRTGAPCFGAQTGPGRARLLPGDPFLGFGPPGDEVETGPLLAPIEPRAILCIGLNYRAHAAATGRELPARPVRVMKHPAALQHPGLPIRIPAGCLDPPQVDFEAELAVVIGRPALDLPAAEALGCVLGYTAANDVSARRWQRHAGGGQWVRGKSFDTFCPLGPVLVTPEEIPDPQSLPLGTWVNGAVMQDGNTADMVFTVAELIAELSRGMTLLPGTVLLTGTPAGVGFARTPPVYLKPGDTVSVEIGGIGRLSNPVEAGT